MIDRCGPISSRHKVTKGEWNKSLAPNEVTYVRYTIEPPEGSADDAAGQYVKQLSKVFDHFPDTSFYQSCLICAQIQLRMGSKERCVIFQWNVAEWQTSVRRLRVVIICATFSISLCLLFSSLTHMQFHDNALPETDSPVTLLSEGDARFVTGFFFSLSSFLFVLYSHIIFRNIGFRDLPVDSIVGHSGNILVKSNSDVSLRINRQQLALIHILDWCITVTRSR